MVRLLLAILLMLPVLIRPALAEGNLKLTILLEPGHPQPVVGEMVNVTIRAVYDRKIANEALTIAPTDAFDWVQTHPDDWHEEKIDGLPWIVMERRIALWPKRAGMLQFGPASHKLTVIDKQSQRQDVTVTAQPLVIPVGEFPALHGWHLAAGGITLTDSLSTDAAHLADGETVTRQIRLRVEGALPEHLPPRPVVSENWLITFAAPVQRELQLTADGPVSEVLWAWQFRPHTGEPGLLEPVKIPYFNTLSRQIETVEIPALTIGYASFFTGQVPTGRLGQRQILLLCAALGAGLLLGLGLAAIRLAPQRGRQAWQQWWTRHSPLHRLAMRRAARQGDLLTLRRLAGEAGLPAARLAAIETALYGRPGAPPG